MPRKAESLRIPSPNLPSYDTDEANRLIDKAFDSQGWLDTNEFGETSHNLDKARHAMFVAFTSNHAVTAVAAGKSRKELADLVQERLVTKYGLYVELFPNGPAAIGAPTSEEEQAAKDFIADTLWRWSTTTNRNAWLQKELADSGMIVLEAKKFSTDPTVAPQVGRYVTDVESAMMDFIENKILADVQKKMGEADQWLATIMLRNPELALPAARKAKALLKAAVDSAHHADPNFVRDTLAIGSAASATPSANVSDDESTTEE
jgi:hypothetical protein